MKTKRSILVAVSALLLSCISMLAGDGSRCLPLKLDKDSLAFRGGEKLVFTIHYKWGLVNADVAQTTLSLDSVAFNGVDCYHGSLRGKTQKIYQQVFKLKEDFDCWFTCKDFKPMKFTRNCVEGSYRCTNLYTYKGDHIEAEINNTKKGEFTIDLPKDDCTYDIAMFFFMIRNMDVSQLKEGGRYPMSYACDHRIRNINFVYMGKENRKVAGKNVRCLKFGFEMPKGEAFDGESSLFMWFSDDNNKIPVYFVAPLKIGQVRGRLNQYEGIRHPLTSVID